MGVISGVGEHVFSFELYLCSGSVDSFLPLSWAIKLELPIRKKSSLIEEFSVTKNWLIETEKKTLNHTLTPPKPFLEVS